MKWIAKALVQKTISFLPQRERLNLFFQRNVTRGVALTDEHLRYKLTHARDHLAYFRKYGAPGPEKLIFELGTGWYPVVPLAFYLTDAGRVYSADLQEWLSKEGQLTTIRKLKAWREAGQLDEYLPDINEEKWAVLLDILARPAAFDREGINTRIGLQTWIGDASRSELADDSVDFICSNNTFEHIFPAALRGILVEFLRIGRPDGVMSHFIDLSDHFAHFDRSLTIYNFLRFSPRQWSLIDNRIQPQNRWRWKDYLALYAELGAPVSETEIRPGDLSALAQVPLHASYAAYSPAELAISHGYIVSRLA